MPEIAHSAQDMISGMTPVLRPDAYVFATTTDPDKIAAVVGAAIATFHEDEGLSLILPIQSAEEAGFPTDHAMCWITLNVYSSLEGVGLTAAVSTALGQAGLPCNMVAAHHHDHVFAPWEARLQAMDILKLLQARGQSDT
jgi:hypothetical protein